jgi:hypothetical protein
MFFAGYLSGLAPTTGTALATAGVACYLALVRALRWRRLRALERAYGSGEGMSLADAQQIIALSLLWDMPGLINYSLAFAMFKTYAVVSVDILLLCAVISLKFVSLRWCALR